MLTTCNLADAYQYFEGSCYPYLQEIGIIPNKKCGMVLGKG